MRRTLIIVSVLLVGSAPTAFASHPGAHQMSRVRDIAHELDRAAQHVHRQAERSQHHFDRAEQAAFRSLHRLADQADHFHRQTERFFQRPSHTERDFLNVVRLYLDAASRLDDLHGSLHVESDFRQVSRLVYDIDRYYGFLDHSGDYGHGHDSRYDSHRNHRYDWRYDRGRHHGYE